MIDSTAKPNAVVAALAATDEKLCFMAARMATATLGSVSRKRRNACSRKMA